MKLQTMMKADNRYDGGSTLTAVPIDRLSGKTHAWNAV
ncbi:hypothetical protein FH603_3119 [Spirosoma sp. LMG 31447]|jgi:hypothetical protein|uniref:Uncharacterized protein n=1 Tax=Spirosoma utsteinense TaxID=2585773 RepID=A0ABR6W7P2_9BACT|nr:hypothetical protein [Spirosoma utsteinense]